MTQRIPMPAAGGLCLTLALAQPHTASAVPAFAGQTGQPCAACHIGAFGPELTQFGRLFKISGYTMQGGSGTVAHFPLALFVQTSLTTTNKTQPAPPAPGFADNSNVALDQVSLFLAGRVSDHIGGFIQATYDGVGRAFHLDNTDVRLTTPATVLGHDAILGLSVNNGPMVQDPYTTTYAWNYPFYSSQLALAPAESPVLGGALLGNTVGLTASAFMDCRVYLEGGVYETQAPGALARLGESYGPGSATAPAPYVRLAYEWNWGANSAHIGAAMLHGKFNPATSLFSADGSVGHDSFTDMFADAGYQFTSASGRHEATLNAFFNHETRELAGTAAMGGATKAHGSLEEIRAAATYYFQNTYGATLAWEHIGGPADPLLFAQGTALSGSANGKPDSNAFIIEADYVPFGKEGSWLAPLANLKLGVQYTLYTEFNGAGHNYDGLGRNASDNNTLFAYAWWVF